MSYFPEITKDGVRFIVSKISNSRKEIEIRVVSDNISQYETLTYDFGGGNNVTYGTLLFSLDTIIKRVEATDDSDVVIPLDDGSYIVVVNHNYFMDDTITDVRDIRRFSFVLKLNKPLPPTIKKLDTINLLTIHSEIIKNEVLYAGKIENELEKWGNPLTPDTSVKPFNFQNEVQTYENQNELTGSIPERRIDNISSGSLGYNRTLVDFGDFKNFVFFSSAEERVKNFKTKLEKIEVELTTISQSLGMLGSEYSTLNTSATIVRNQSFGAIDAIINEFTEYERWLYFDSQKTSKYSCPGLGESYGFNDGSLTESDNLKRYLNDEGFDEYYVLSGSSEEKIDIVKDKYKLEDYRFANTTGSIYLSFLMRASSSVSDNFVHQNTQTSSIPNYPMDSMHLKNISIPAGSGSQYQRYIFVASGSYWIPSVASKTVGHSGIDFGKGSSEVVLTSGSGIYSNSISALSQYANYLTTPTGSGVSVTGSFVPRGDLFNISVSPTGDTNLSGIITDIKVTENNPNLFMPFHTLASTTSDTFTEWYDDLITSASLYDAQNIQRLINNVPGYFLNNSQTNKELIKYVNSISEFYDDYRNLIDDYYRVFNKGYSDYEKVPTKFNRLLAENLGNDILPIEESNFLKLFGLNENLTNSGDYSDRVINNVLNNLMYLYKTKGTKNSLNALLNCYGLPSDVLSFKEGGVSLKSYESTFLSNDTQISADIFYETGSNHAETRNTELNSIIINDTFDNNNFKVVWNTSNVISQSSIEAVVKMPNTSNTMSIFTSYNSDDSKKLWELSLVPSSSSSTKGRFEFRLSNQAAGSTDLPANSSLLKTEFIDVLDNSLINVALQRSASGHDISGVQTYELMVGKSNDSNISLLTGSKINIDGDSDSTSNKNFMSGSLSSHLFICQDFTGSVSQIKSWSTPLSFTAFKQHIYNKKSVVGNNFTASTNELQFHYPLQENYKSGSNTNFKILDASALNLGGEFELDNNMFNSQSVNYDVTPYVAVNFPHYGNGAGSLQYSDNFVTIEQGQKMLGDLNPNSSILDFNVNLSNREFIHTRDLRFERSPQEIINDFLKDLFGNLDFNDLFADPRDEYKSTYPDLDSFNEKLASYNLSVDLTRFIDATRKIFNNSFVESIKKLIPNKAKLSIGNTLKPTYTHRIKMNSLSQRPDSGLMVQPSTERENFEGLSLGGGIFNPSQGTLHGFSTTTSSLGAFEDLSSVNDEIDSGDTNISEEYLLTPLRQNPQYQWGTGSNDLHFKNPHAPGKLNDFNTYHYEEDCLFVALNNPEKLIPTTSSYGVDNTDYKSESSFVHKRNLKTSQAVPLRPLGRTAQFYSTSSIASPYGKVLDSDTRIPRNHFLNEKAPRYYNYEGTKLGDYGTLYTNTQHPGSTLWDESALWNPFGSDENNEQEWLDLSTASFYRKLIVSDNTTLRVVREDQMDEGNIIT